MAGVAKLLKELLKALPSIQAHVSVSSLYAEWAMMQFKAEVSLCNTFYGVIKKGIRDLKQNKILHVNGRLFIRTLKHTESH